MSIPLVATYLRSGKSYADLLTEHGVNAKPYNGRVSFVYDQLAARDADPLACQCRGLVLREGTWETLARPFDRFFSLGQRAAADIDWATACVQEKLDGTLLIVYHDDGWKCATRSCSEAQATTPLDDRITFAQLADRAAQNLGHANLAALMSYGLGHPMCTHIFELIAPENRIVCQYQRADLVLLGVRDRDTGEEFSGDCDSAKFGVQRPCEYDWHDPAVIREHMRDWSPLDHEGVVVVDAQFRRIKIKTEQYVAAAHIRDSVAASWRRAVELVVSGHADDMKPALPEFVVERIETAESGVRALLSETEADFARINTTDDMKTYALAAKQCRWPAALFNMKRKGGGALDFARQATTDHVTRLLGLEDAA